MRRVKVWTFVVIAAAGAFGGSLAAKAMPIGGTQDSCIANGGDWDSELYDGVDSNGDVYFYYFDSCTRQQSDGTWSQQYWSDGQYSGWCHFDVDSRSGVWNVKSCYGRVPPQDEPDQTTSPNGTTTTNSGTTAPGSSTPTTTTSGTRATTTAGSAAR